MQKMSMKLLTEKQIRTRSSSSVERKQVQAVQKTDKKKS